MSLLQLCSSQLKLLQLYTNIQQLQAAARSEPALGHVSGADRQGKSGTADGFCSPSSLQDGLEDLDDELLRVLPVLQQYAEFAAKPGVSFAQDLPSSPLPVQAFLSHMECSEDGEVQVIGRSETEWNQLGKSILCIYVFTLAHNVSSNRTVAPERTWQTFTYKTTSTAGGLVSQAK